MYIFNVNKANLILNMIHNNFKFQPNEKTKMHYQLNWKPYKSVTKISNF